MNDLDQPIDIRFLFDTINKNIFLDLPVYGILCSLFNFSIWIMYSIAPRVKDEPEPFRIYLLYDLYSMIST